MERRIVALSLALALLVASPAGAQDFQQMPADRFARRMREWAPGLAGARAHLGDDVIVLRALAIDMRTCLLETRVTLVGPTGTRSVSRSVRIDRIQRPEVSGAIVRVPVPNEEPFVLPFRSASVAARFDQALLRANDQCSLVDPGT